MQRKQAKGRLCVEIIIYYDFTLLPVDSSAITIDVITKSARCSVKAKFVCKKFPLSCQF